MTIIKGTVASTDVLFLKDAGTATFNTTALNVSSFTSLAAALDFAATNALGLATTSAVDWFQYAGNTYVVEDMGTGVATAGLSADDYVVKITGLVDLSSATFSTSAVTLTLG
jgi:S-layer protein